jgi:tetratricopeptide (TPR) repeat protein
MRGQLGLRNADFGFKGRKRLFVPHSEFRNPKVLGVLFLFPLLLLSCGALWQTDAARGVELARTGEYAAAVSALEPAVAGGNNDSIVIESLYYAWIRQGEYQRARERFQAWATARPNVGALRLAAARANRVFGAYPAAIAHLDAVPAASDAAVAASYEKARVLEETGKRSEAQAAYDRIVQNFLNTRNMPPRNLVYVGGALHATEQFQDANDVYRTATKSDPRNAEAWVAWGELLADKYNEADAVRNFQDALNIDPNMPEALLGMAMNLALSDPEVAEASFEKLHTVNPNMPRANLFAATQQIESEQYDAALESINKALAINPSDAEALSLVAAVSFMRGDTAKFSSDVAKVTAVNPEYSKLYFILAENSVSVRLYEDAVKFAAKAVELNPRDWKSMSLLGLNLQRLGQYSGVELPAALRTRLLAFSPGGLPTAAAELGELVLEEAFKGDPFNTWTGNTLTLLDSMKKNFEQFQSANFHIKLDRSESAALRPYVVDLLEKAHRDLSAKYGFTPQGPISFEMFPNHGDFEVRAVGLTGLGALGVCFGRVFVMDSPSAREPDHFNWGSTLWHEFTHVITLQMTDHKIPRWFSEGLSVFEERKAYPGWGDDLKLDNLTAVKRKELLPIAKLNDGFIRPKGARQVMVSYYQASMVAEYIEGKWGFPAIRNMLGLYKAGRSTADVFKQALGMSPESFDAEFLKWMDSRVASISSEEYRKLYEAGVEALGAGELDKAITSLKSAVAIYPEYSDEENAYEPLAEAYLQKSDKPAAIETLKQYMSYSELSFPSYVKLSELLQESGDRAGAAKAMEGAMYVRPMDLLGHTKLGGLLLDLKQYGAAAREYETLLALKTPDRATAYYLLAQAYLGDGKRSEARRAVLNSLDIAPSYEPAQKLLVEILK